MTGAIADLRRVVAGTPNDAAAINNLGVYALDLGLASAATLFRRDLALRPATARGCFNLGCAWLAELRVDGSAGSFRRAVALDPTLAVAYNNLALALQRQGDAKAAIDGLRRCLALAPDLVEAHRNLLAAILYDPDWTQEHRWRRHEDFGARFTARHPPRFRSWRSDRDPNRRLRIGYLSADLIEGHPVARNLRPLIAAHDRGRVEVFIYADSPRPDGETERFRGLADGWRRIDGGSDDAVADLIHGDAIDILVVLAGRYQSNRPLVALRRPAPLQVSFHDTATGGLPTIDYLLADRHMVPGGTTERFAERVARLPCFYLHDPMAEAPALGPPPLSKTGSPTFGCFNHPVKLSGQTLDLWAEILRRVPAATLVLKNKNLLDEAVARARVLEAFRRRGVDAERIRLRAGMDDRFRHLLHYDEIDVALDPWPFSGSTTTFEALWMGVPVVALRGESMAARWSAAMLTALKRDEWVADSPQRYVDVATGLVADADGLVRIRAALRQQVADSPLCDARGRARQIERLFRAIWRRWCQTATS